MCRKSCSKSEGVYNSLGAVIIITCPFKCFYSKTSSGGYFYDILKRNICVGKVKLVPVHTLDDAGKGLVGAASPVPLTVNISAQGEVSNGDLRTVHPRNPTIICQRVEIIRYIYEYRNHNGPNNKKIQLLSI